MSVLSIIVCSVVGALAYTQIGRWLGWWSYRTMQKHLRFERISIQYDRELDSHVAISFFIPLAKRPDVSMRLLFPIVSLRWVKGESEMEVEAFCSVLLRPESDRELILYRWLMTAFWPLKVVWCLGAYLILGCIVSSRLATHLLKWSYRLLFTWPERKVAETEPQDIKKTVSQEHTVN